MSEFDTDNDPLDEDVPSSGGVTGPLVLTLAGLIALAGAFVPFSSLHALQAPQWLGLVAAGIVFPILPLLWHLGAERRRDKSKSGVRARTRFALRAAAVALVSIASAFANLGPQRVNDNVLAVVKPKKVAPPPAVAEPEPEPEPEPTPQPEPAPPARRGHPLEPLIPADATLVVGMSGSAGMRQLLAAHGIDTREKYAALDKCHIEMDQAQVLIAARDANTHMAVISAPGITDEGNLYCLVGVLGEGRVKLHFHRNQIPASFTIRGLINDGALTFTQKDGQTLIMVDEEWRDTFDIPLLAAVGGNASGPLAAALERVDRSAPLWVVSVTDTEGGPWDLAIDAQESGSQFKLRASSVPPSGKVNAAELELLVPLPFVAALPANVLSTSIQGVVSAITAAGDTLPPPDLGAAAVEEEALPPAATPAPAPAPAARVKVPPSVPAQPAPAASPPPAVEEDTGPVDL